MKRSRTLVGVLALTAVLALVAAGCSGSDDDDGDAIISGATATTSQPDDGGSGAPVTLEGAVNDEGSEDISGDGASAELDIELDDSSFSPTYVKAAPGSTVEVSLANGGDVSHTFTLDDGSVAQELAPGEEATVTVTIPESGSLRFSCDFHGSGGMQGAFYTEGASSSGDGSSDDDSTTTTADPGGSSSGY